MTGSYLTEVSYLLHLPILVHLLTLVLRLHEMLCVRGGGTVWRPKNKVLSEKIFFDDFDQDRMHRSTLMHIYKFLLSLDRSELMCEHPLLNKEITRD